MVWIFAISAATTSRATSYSSSGVTSCLRMTCCGLAGLRSPLVRVRLSCRLLAELVHEGVVLAREQIVVEAHPDGPVVGKRRRLPGPPTAAGSDRRRCSSRQIARTRQSRRTCDSSSQLRADPSGSRFTRRTERLVVAIDLRRIPPGRVVIARMSLGARVEIVLPAAVNIAGRRILAIIRRGPPGRPDGSRVAAPAPA